MTRIRPLLTIAVLTLLVSAICATTMRASPTNCDNLCRRRQYIGWHDAGATTWTYYKFEQATCTDCTYTNGLCLPAIVDPPDLTNLECKGVAGKEKDNKKWVITSTSVCDYDIWVQQPVQAKAAEPNDKDKYTQTPVTECRPKPIPGDG